MKEATFDCEAFKQWEAGRIFEMSKLQCAEFFQKVGEHISVFRIVAAVVVVIFIFFFSIVIATNLANAAAD